MDREPSDSRLATFVRRGGAFSLLITTLLIILSAFLIVRFSLWILLQQELALVKAAGHPITVEEMEGWLPAVTTNQLADVNFREGLLKLIMDPEADELLRDEEINFDRGPVVFPTKRRQEVLALLDRNDEAITLLERPPQSNKSDTPGYPLEDLQRVQRGTHLLLLRAVFAIENGDLDQAGQALASALALPDSLPVGRSMEFEWIRLTSMKKALRVLEFAMSQSQFPAVQLSVFQSIMHPESFPYALERALIVDRCLGIHRFRLPAAEWVQTYPHEEIAKRVAFQKLTGIWDHEQRLYLSIMGQYVKTARQPLPERMTSAEKFAERASHEHDCAELFTLLSGHSVATLLLPSAERNLERSAETQVVFEAAKIALAVDSYRARNFGQLPGSLTDLLTNELEKVPADPFDGRPFRYKRLNRGFAVYSVGPDGEDNAGKPKDNTNRDAPYDLIFSVDR